MSKILKSLFQIDLENQNYSYLFYGFHPDFLKEISTVKLKLLLILLDLL